MALIGINGRDPNTNEPFVLISVDSRGIINKSDLENRIISDLQKKLFANSASNYVVGVSGPIILGKYFSRNLEDAQLNKFLNKQRNIREDEIKEYVGEMLRYINGVLMQRENKQDDFLVAFKSDEPKLLTFSNGYLRKAGIVKVLGRGISLDSLNYLDDYVKNGRVVLSKRKMSDFVLESLRDASALNSAVGGYMRSAIITPSGVFLPSPCEISVINYANFKKQNNSDDSRYYPDQEGGIHPDTKGCGD